MTDHTDMEKVAELLDVEHGLTPWEIDFAERIDGLLEDDETLTLGQQQKLDEIWRDRCGG